MLDKVPLSVTIQISATRKKTKGASTLKFRDYFPSSWYRTILYPDITRLEYFGTENLKLMLQEWQIHRKAYQTVLKVYKRQGNDSHLGFYESSLKKAEIAIPAIQKAIENTEWKPPLIAHRTKEGYFSEGEYIYIYAQDDDFPELRGSRYKRVRVYATEIGSVYAMLQLRSGARLDIGGSVQSPTFLKQKEILYFKKDPDYMDFWLENMPNEPEDKDFIATCIQSTRIRAKPR